MVNPAGRFGYRVNDVDEIVAVNAAWLAFARENGAQALTEERVLQRKLWDFIVDTATIRLYRELHTRIRHSGAAAVVSFRCDSPTLARHMRLTITPEAGGALAYESVLLRTEPLAGHKLLERSALRSETLLTMCSSCKRSLIETHGWLEIQEVLERLRLTRQSLVPMIRYTLCPICVAMIDREPLML